MKHAINKRYHRALKFMKKAAEMEPFNADYQFNLACVHAELNQVEDSNRALMSIIKNIDPTAVECYFGIACNYFDMGDLKKAREYLEKYVSSGREGEFDDLAQDILCYLEMFENAEPESKNRKRISRLFSLGKKFLETADYGKACLQFEKVIEIDPFQLSARNYLALACFLNNDIDRAISLAESVLKVEEYNVFARLNLALIYAYKKMEDKCEEHLAAAAKISHDGTDRFMVFFKNVIGDIDVEPLVKGKFFEVLKPKPPRKNFTVLN